ncbi:MAG: acyltransferase family protein [Saprospiraceae bacterium]
MNMPTSTRLHSLDVFRGITMFLLMAEAAMVYQALTNYFPDGFGHSIVQQFHHHPWNGLRFWDLIQPFFMFIVGVAMPFSLRSRLKRGDSWNDAFRHILYRCMMLFLFGVGLHCVYSGRIVWELWNVLTQLSFTILLTFLILHLSWKKQLAVSIFCLLLTEILYRLYDPATPFVKDANFGSWMDLLLMSKIDDGGGWVTINCLPTAAHTIWGAICGKLLLSQHSASNKLKWLIIGGVIALVLGYGLDLAEITPIIKRIATSSFALASGGWALLTLAFLYWFVDIKGYQRWTPFFAIVGMNSIFIYLFGETIGVQWLGGFGKVFSYSIFGALGVSELGLAVINGFFVLGMMWGLCYFLYRKGIFFRV